MNKNKEGYPDPTASRAIRNADKIPKEISYEKKNTATENR